MGITLLLLVYLLAERGCWAQLEVQMIETATHFTARTRPGDFPLSWQMYAEGQGQYLHGSILPRGPDLPNTPRYADNYNSETVQSPQNKPRIHRQPQEQIENNNTHNNNENEPKQYPQEEVGLHPFVTEERVADPTLAEHSDVDYTRNYHKTDSQPTCNPKNDQYCDTLVTNDHKHEPNLKSDEINSRDSDSSEQSTMAPDVHNTDDTRNISNPNLKQGYPRSVDSGKGEERDYLHNSDENTKQKSHNEEKHIDKGDEDKNDDDKHGNNTSNRSSLPPSNYRRQQDDVPKEAIKQGDILPPPVSRYLSIPVINSKPKESIHPFGPSRGRSNVIVPGRSQEIQKNQQTEKNYQSRPSVSPYLNKPGSNGRLGIVSGGNNQANSSRRLHATRGILYKNAEEKKNYQHPGSSSRSRPVNGGRPSPRRLQATNNKENEEKEKETKEVGRNNYNRPGTNIRSAQIDGGGTHIISPRKLQETHETSQQHEEDEEEENEEEEERNYHRPSPSGRPHLVDGGRSYDSPSRGLQETHGISQDDDDDVQEEEDSEQEVEEEEERNSQGNYQQRPGPSSQTNPISHPVNYNKEENNALAPQVNQGIVQNSDLHNYANRYQRRPPVSRYPKLLSSVVGPKSSNMNDVAASVRPHLNHAESYNTGGYYQRRPPMQKIHNNPDSSDKYVRRKHPYATNRYSNSKIAPETEHMGYQNSHHEDTFEGDDFQHLPRWESYKIYPRELPHQQETSGDNSAVLRRVYQTAPPPRRLSKNYNVPQGDNTNAQEQYYQITNFRTEPKPKARKSGKYEVTQNDEDTQRLTPSGTSVETNGFKSLPIANSNYQPSPSDNDYQQGKHQEDVYQRNIHKTKSDESPHVSDDDYENSDDKHINKNSASSYVLGRSPRDYEDIHESRGSDYRANEETPSSANRGSEKDSRYAPERYRHIENEEDYTGPYVIGNDRKSGHRGEINNKNKIYETPQASGVSVEEIDRNEQGRYDEGNSSYSPERIYKVIDGTVGVSHDRVQVGGQYGNDEEYRGLGGSDGNPQKYRTGNVGRRSQGSDGHYTSVANNKPPQTLGSDYVKTYPGETSYRDGEKQRDPYSSNGDYYEVDRVSNKRRPGGYQGRNGGYRRSYKNPEVVAGDRERELGYSDKQYQGIVPSGAVIQPTDRDAGQIDKVTSRGVVYAAGVSGRQSGAAKSQDTGKVQQDGNRGEQGLVRQDGQNYKRGKTTNMPASDRQDSNSSDHTTRSPEAHNTGLRQEGARDVQDWEEYGKRREYHYTLGDKELSDLFGGQGGLASQPGISDALQVGPSFKDGASLLQDSVNMYVFGWRK